MGARADEDAARAHFSGDAKLVGKLRLEAEQVKINLCNESAPQDFHLEAPTAGIDELAYTLQPADFEAMIRPLLERTLKEVDVALASALKQHEVGMDDIDAFILVGGSSKIPAVTRFLKDKYRKPIKSDLNPDEIVAMGAARMGLNYDPSTGAQVLDGRELELDKNALVPAGLANTNIKDVVSHTPGIGLIDDLYDALIPKDHIIPPKVVRGGYTTAQDNQTNIMVPVYQGDASKASQNTRLGQVVISGLSPEPKGRHQFDRRGGTTEYRVISSVYPYLISTHGFSIEGIAIDHENVIDCTQLIPSPHWTEVRKQHPPD